MLRRSGDVIPPPAASGSAGQDTDHRHLLSFASAQSCLTLAHGLSGRSYIVPDTHTHVWSWGRAICRVPAATLVGLICWSSGKIKEMNEHSMSLLNGLFCLLGKIPVPPQVSHMWQLVQPVVLRCGHMQALSSASVTFFPAHCSARILHTLTTLGFLLITWVSAHNSKEDLGTKTLSLSRQQIKFTISKWSLTNVLALMRHSTKTSSFGKRLPLLTVAQASQAWMLSSDCGIQTHHSSTLQTDSYSS